MIALLDEVDRIGKRCLRCRGVQLGRERRVVQRQEAQLSIQSQALGCWLAEGCLHGIPKRNRLALMLKLKSGKLLVLGSIGVRQ